VQGTEEKGKNVEGKAKNVEVRGKWERKERPDRENQFEFRQ
jgi:hypothetical protein